MKRYALTSLDKEVLAKLLSINISCLKSFCETIGHKKIGKWRAISQDMIFPLKNFISEVMQFVISAIQVAIGKVTIVAALVVLSCFLENIIKPHPRINKITHDVECNQYGVCDK